MTLYCGIDLHANNSVIAVLDETDRVVMERRVANELSQILAVLEPYRAELTGCVVESTYNWYWLVDGLMEAGFVVHLAHTGAVPMTIASGFRNGMMLAHIIGSSHTHSAITVRDLGRMTAKTTPMQLTQRISRSSSEL
jgi:hypothetical protein